MTQKKRLLTLTVVSGVLSYVGTELLRTSGVYLAGVPFGVLVLAPRAGGARLAARRAFIVLLSASIYYGAVKLAMYQAITLHVPEMIACGLSGFFGALAVGAASRLVLASHLSFDRLLKAGAIGAAAGALLGINDTFHVPDVAQRLILILGFTAWQTGVAFALLGADTRGKQVIQEEGDLSAQP